MLILVSLIVIILVVALGIYLLLKLVKMDDEKLNKLFKNLNVYYPPDHWF